MRFLEMNESNNDKTGLPFNCSMEMNLSNFLTFDFQTKFPQRNTLVGMQWCGLSCAWFQIKCACVSVNDKLPCMCVPTVVCSL